MAKNKLSTSEKIQAFLSIVLSTLAGATIWTNNSIDLLNKLGWTTINEGKAFLVFASLFVIGLAWFVVSIAKKFN
jgi:hypothetical protein